MEQLNRQVEQQKQGSNNGLIISILVIIIVMLLGYIGYIYSTKNIVKKEFTEENYIKKEDVAFDNLPQYIQDKYVLKSLYDYKINEIETQRKSTLKKLEEAVIKNEPQIVEKIIEAEEDIHTRMDTNIELVPKEQITSITTTPKAVNNKQKTETYTCKTLKSSSEYVTKKCKKELLSFFNKNKDAKRFEIIGLVDEREFLLLNSLEDVYGKKRLGNLPKYAQSGLSRQRVVEASWVIRQYLGKDIDVNGVNYTITKKNKRGFVVKAYR